MKKKVLFFLQFGVGGAERMTILMGKMLPQERFESKFFLIKKNTATSSVESFIPSEYDRNIIDVPGTFSLLQSLYKVLKKEKPDVVFSSVLYLNDKLLPLKIFFPKVKFVVRCENYLYTFSKLQKFAINFLYRKADVVVAQTKEMGDELVSGLGFETKKVKVLENPIDVDTIRQKLETVNSPYDDNGKKHFVASGRFAYQKGFDDLVSAFAEVARSRSDVDLFIIGRKDGPSQTEFERVWKLVKKFGIEKDVHCVGFQDNPYKYVRYADCFVLSSRWEGLPNVLIEALYLGTPAAAIKCIPIVERIVKNEVNGFLAEPNNINSLAKAMRSAINLGRIKTSYEGASKESIVELFE